MNGQQLLNNTLRINAAFSALSGLDFLFFDRAIVKLLTGTTSQSLASTGVMLIAFAIFVFAVSILKSVNKYLVVTIIIMDLMWVAGSALLVAAGGSELTVPGHVLIIAVALLIAGFAIVQGMGLRRHLRAA